MGTSNLPRHQIIDSLTEPLTEEVADAAINLWEPLASQIILIVGEGGFNSLYARSLFLAQPTFPWLAGSSQSPQADQRFMELKTRLEGQAPAQASAANRLLLITFTDILASLIGEELTVSILHLAWGAEDLLAGHSQDAAYRVNKEMKNE